MKTLDYRFALPLANWKLERFTAGQLFKPATILDDFFKFGLRRFSAIISFLY
jgi:hypothetical protein